jgi:hypothetical protein
MRRLVRRPDPAAVRFHGDDFRAYIASAALVSELARPRLHEKGDRDATRYGIRLGIVRDRNLPENLSKAAKRKTANRGRQPNARDEPKNAFRFLRRRVVPTTNLWFHLVRAVVAEENL